MDNVALPVDIPMICTSIMDYGKCTYIPEYQTGPMQNFKGARFAI